MSDLAAKKVSFFQKNDTLCPICEQGFRREELLTGGGRMIAGNLQDDLRRLYEPSKKFGEVFPLIYSVTTCPHCYYSALSSDFTEVSDKAKPALRDQVERRKDLLKPLFGSPDFQRSKGLKEGAAGYMLALFCYEAWPASDAPTFKMGLCALRGAWVCEDLHRKFPSENWDYLAKVLFHKARYLYNRVIEKEQSGGESVAFIGHFGPDTDNNFGYDGVLYLAGYLEYKYGAEDNDEKQRAASLASARRMVAKFVGLGKASKGKPSVLIDKARDLHHLMGEEIED